MKRALKTNRVVLCCGIIAYFCGMLCGVFALYAQYESKATENYGSVVVSRVLDVHDGDTFNVNIESYPPIVGQVIAVRIIGINTPEINDKREEVRKLALKARGYLEMILNTSTCVELRCMKRDKYFRILAQVYADDVDVATFLIENKVAKLYKGDKKDENWEELLNGEKK